LSEKFLWFIFTESWKYQIKKQNVFGTKQEIKLKHEARSFINQKY